MPATTGIQWTDATWNPVTGCDKVSAGCKFCYAELITGRYPRAFPTGFALTLRPERLEAPLRWRTPRRVFVNSMSDLFHEQIPFEYIERVFDVIVRAPQHTFQILTKRPERMAAFSDGYGRWPANAWAGTSIEAQLTAPRLTALLRVDAPVRFVSAEPLLGPLDLTRAGDLAGLGWLIVGGESGQHFWKGGRLRERRFLVEHVGPKRFTPRPEAVEWVTSLREQARAAGTAFFFKQWGGPTPKAAGARLHGRRYEQYPQLATEVR